MGWGGKVLFAANYALLNYYFFAAHESICVFCILLPSQKKKCMICILAGRPSFKSVGGWCTFLQRSFGFAVAP